MHAGPASVHVREPVRPGHAGDDPGGAAGHHTGESVRRPREEEPVRGAPRHHGAGVLVHPRRAVRVRPGPAGVVREGAGVEGARRRQRRALHLLHVRQLVLCVMQLLPLFVCNAAARPYVVLMGMKSVDRSHLTRFRLKSPFHYWDVKWFRFFEEKCEMVEGPTRMDHAMSNKE